uniref:Si:ch211-131k2.3 n=1 Tax=Sinocyclocheilus rhinocerous TaxID=307959 RepID=A0A673FU05_9TELE
EVKMPKIVRPENWCEHEEHWYDRKKYVTINFVVQNPKDVQVDIQDTKIILSCKDDSREKVFDRTINVLIRKKDPAKPAWLLVNWRDWEHEEEDGMAEYEQYMDMLNEMKTNGEPPAMDDLDDLSD